MSKIRVGIVGLSAARGWGAGVHIPALRDLPDYEIRACATTRQSSADEAAKKFGIPLAFDNARKLAEHPEVDLVAVTVKAPAHHTVVMAALEAGKHVYCEWPLGVGLDQVREMRDLARAKGVCHMIGLQAQGAPAVNHARDLIQEGRIGEVLSATMLSTVPNWALGMDSANAYILDAKNGATLLHIAGGHSLDLFSHCLGEWQSLNANLAVRRATTVLADTKEKIDITAPDHIAISGTLKSGAIAAVHIQGGVPHATKFLFEINGSKGSLILSDSGPLSAQMAPLKLMGAFDLKASLKEIEIPARYRHVPDSYGESHFFNVAQLYARLAEAIQKNDPSLAQPDFNHALIRHKTLEAIEQAARTGQRQTL